MEIPALRFGLPLTGALLLILSQGPVTASAEGVVAGGHLSTQSSGSHTGGGISISGNGFGFQSGTVQTGNGQSSAGGGSVSISNGNLSIGFQAGESQTTTTTTTTVRMFQNRLNPSHPGIETGGQTGGISVQIRPALPEGTRPLKKPCLAFDSRGVCIDSE